MARRFIVDKNDIRKIGESGFEITGSEVKHIQVLRHNIGDEITVNNYVCKISDIRKDKIILEKINDAERIGEPNTNVTLYMAMLKNDKMDFVVQKAVELGVKKIVPFFSNNVIVKLDDKSKSKRIGKLQTIANEACKQCGRTDYVIVEDFVNFKEIINLAENHDISVFAYEKETKSLKEVMNKANINNYTNISLVIGPEGGFDKIEAEQLSKGYNVETISLGTRILRAETAALNLVSIIMYELEI